MKTGIELITEERQRQISQEGWTAEHDDQYLKNELQYAAVCYASDNLDTSPPPYWPWHPSWWKPSTDPGRNWTKAGALYLAERDRQTRLGNAEEADRMESKANKCASRIDCL